MRPFTGDTTATEAFEHRLLAHDDNTFRAVAYFLGERIDTRALEGRLAVAPTIVEAGTRGWVVLFRYGGAVFFGTTDAEEEAFVAALGERIVRPFDRPELEKSQVWVKPHLLEGVDEHAIAIMEPSLLRLQAVAEILAKSVVLAHYEREIATVFDKIEPLAARLQESGRGKQEAKDLLKQLGGTLMVQYKMVARVEVTEKPEMLWEQPQLERLYMRLEDEYELRERHLALERKLSLIANTAETLLELVQAQRTLRVEWYIVFLILFDICLGLYKMIA